MCCMFFFQAEDGIRDLTVTGVQTCALPISTARRERRDVVERRTVVKPHDEGDQPGPDEPVERRRAVATLQDRKSTRLNSSHSQISYAVFCFKKKEKKFFVPFFFMLDLIMQV